MVEGLIGITSGELDRFKFHVEPYLKRLSPHSGYGIEDVYEAVEQKKMQLWAGEYYVVLTQVIQHPQFKTLHLFFVAGDKIDVWEATALDLLVDFARAKGCERITAHGRDGWKSRMKKCGFKHDQGIYCKVIV